MGENSTTVGASSVHCLSVAVWVSHVVVPSTCGVVSLHCMQWRIGTSILPVKEKFKVSLSKTCPECFSTFFSTILVHCD